MSERLEELTRELALEREALRRADQDKLNTLPPNPTQWRFLNSKARETMFSGLNQAGKSTILRVKATIGLTGLYPEGYTGHRHDGPIEGALCAYNAVAVRDKLTDPLLGPDNNRGSGYIPAHCFDPKKDIAYAGGNTHKQIDFFYVDWHDEFGKVQGRSKCYCMAYQQNAERIAGYPLNEIWIDEEPKSMEVYNEISARTNFTKGFVYMAMTPLYGVTPLILHYEDEERQQAGLTDIIYYDIDQADHISDEDKQELKTKYKGHAQESARLRGRPVRGEGVVYPVSYDQVVIPDMEVPTHWQCLIGVDFPHTSGTFAAVKGYLNPEDDQLILTAERKLKESDTPTYAEALKSMDGDIVPIAWPHDGGRGAGEAHSGISIAERYRNLGCNMLGMSAHSLAMGKEDRSLTSITAECYDRMYSGRLKLFASLHELWREIQTYRTTDGVVKQGQNDHCIDAMHKLVMMLRFAEVVETIGRRQRRDVYMIEDPCFFDMI